MRFRKIEKVLHSLTKVFETKLNLFRSKQQQQSFQSQVMKLSFRSKQLNYALWLCWNGWHSFSLRQVHEVDLPVEYLKRFTNCPREAKKHKSGSVMYLKFIFKVHTKSHGQCHDLHFHSTIANVTSSCHELEIKGETKYKLIPTLKIFSFFFFWLKLLML